MKRKYAWVVLIASLVVLLPLRLYESLVMLEPKTGFYTDGGRLSAITAVVAAAAVVLAAFTGYRGEPFFKDGRRPMKSISTAVAAAVAGVVLAFVSVGGLVAAPSGDGAVLYRIFSAAGIAAGAVFLTEAYGFATGAMVLERYPLAMLLPSVWGCLGLMVLFVQFSAAVNTLNNAYYTCTVIFLLLFLFSQAKLFTGIDSEKSGRMIYLSGVPAVILALATSVPGIVLFAQGEAEGGFLMAGLHIVNLLLAVYAAVFLSAAGHAQQNGKEWNDENGSGASVPSGEENESGPERPRPLTAAEEWALPSLSEAEEDVSPLKPFRPERPACKEAGESAAAGKYARSALGSPELLGGGPSVLDLVADFLRESAGSAEKFVECGKSPFLSAEERAGS